MPPEGVRGGDPGEGGSRRSFSAPYSVHYWIFILLVLTSLWPGRNHCSVGAYGRFNEEIFMRGVQKDFEGGG